MVRRVLPGFGVGLGLAVLGGGLYRRRWWGLARLLGLPSARYAVRLTQSLAVPMPDGVVLRADHYYPRDPGSFPTILIRSPYGRGTDLPAPLGWPFRVLGALLAACGYHVLIQTTRGRFDSGGTFDPGMDEGDDGRATLAWIAAQPWFNGALGTWGPSYLGFTQWALAVDAPPYLKALVPASTSSRLGALIHADGALALDLALRWIFFLEALDTAGRWTGLHALYRVRPANQARALAPAFSHLPLGEADAIAFGRPVAYGRAWLAAGGAQDPSRERSDHRAGVARVTAPVLLLSGWYDFMLSELLADYALLQAAGRPPRLVIGPWAHTDMFLGLTNLREGLRWFETYLKGVAPRPSSPVRLFVLGARRWRNLETWPPPAHATRLFLQGGAGLAPDPAPAATPPDSYRYDPADPTPAVGGALLFPPAGPRDNRDLEARPDVLCYTTAPLAADLEVIGPVTLELYVCSDREHTDFFGRVCDVHPGGLSVNICDGLFRVAPGRGTPQPDGSLRLVIALGATAVCFRRGHRIRLQVSSGAHPRWSRNLGTGDPPFAGTGMVVATQTIYHDRAHPAALVLPVRDSTG